MNSEQYKLYYHTVKHRVFELLHEEFQPPNDKLGRLIVRFLTLLIALNVLAVILGSIEGLEEEFRKPFLIFEYISIIIFTVEYISEVWTANLDPKYSGIVVGRVKYIFSAMAIVDLLAFLPFYLPFLFPFDLRFLRIFRMFRIFHLFTLGHYSDAFETIKKIIEEKKEALVMTLFIGVVIIFVSSILIYLLEHEKQHETFSDLFVIMYWVALTLTGRSHVLLAPITIGGQIIAGIIEILGIMFFILPTGIIASGFITHMSHDQSPSKKHRICPHCTQKFQLDTDGKPEPLPVSPKDKFNAENLTLYQQTQRRIYSVLNSKESSDYIGRFITIFLILLILLNILATMLETVENFDAQYGSILHIFDLFSIGIFTIEYLLRIWVCQFDENESFHSPIKGRLRFMISPMALIDLIAILPFYLPMFFNIDLRFLRIIRLIRFFRLLKFGRYSTSLENMGAVFKEKKASLGVSFFIMAILWIFISTLIYYAEHEAQPENFSSIPMAMGWAIMSMTSSKTDFMTITPFGNILSVLEGFLIMSLLALPTGIIGSGFVEHMQHRNQTIICPYCGKETNPMHNHHKKQ